MLIVYLIIGSGKLLSMYCTIKINTFKPSKQMFEQIHKLQVLLKLFRLYILKTKEPEL